MLIKRYNIYLHLMFMGPCIVVMF